jgi:hypothetical protein
MKDSGSDGNHLSPDAKKYVHRGVLCSFFFNCGVGNGGKNPCLVMFHENSNPRYIFSAVQFIMGWT